MQFSIYVLNFIQRGAQLFQCNTLLLVTWFYKPQTMSVHNCPREHTLVKAMNG